MDIIIESGGQTGVDKRSLEVARDCGLPTGGTAAMGFMTENGPDFTLRDVFGLKECSRPGYPARTEENVRNTDATVLFGDTSSAGSILANRLCKKYSKPILENPTADELVNWVLEKKIKILNVAGNRGSKLAPPDRIAITAVLWEAFTKLKEL